MHALQRFNYILIVFFILIFSTNSHAAPALFKVEKNGMQSYLFGTVHVGNASMEGLPENVKHAITASEEVIVEVDITKLTPLQMQQRSMPYMLLSPGKSLKTELSPENYAKLSNYFAKKNINIAMFNSLKPWAVMMTMLQIEFQNAGYSDQLGIDKQILAFAKDKNKPIGELETFEVQMQMFDQLTTLNNQMIEETFEQLNDIQTYFLDLVTAWKKGDMATLSHYYNKTFDNDQYGQMSEQVMLINRNNKWVEALSERLTKARLFIAVGALHLPQKHGLIKQLQANGFNVTRL
ncbi:TraB/GumN family protein [Pseudoalteromonas sp. MMG010]|uniref:TraB/GumN family protein n=1 Tax=Pseudoalteromonas sp. MMG010 TaxID=2822685 RepID=UPI001B3A0E75|nr:TraB/GumN family protein [Pseudoalteromonas sp. MMG010]MBQ4834205.1 TraB/GumN family protein [Pseudoalteromonas sp. MMG010]